MRGAEPEDAGEVLAGRIVEMMREVSFPGGLQAVGYSEEDVEGLTKVALPQKRLLDNAPKICGHTEVSGVFRAAMQYY